MMKVTVITAVLNRAAALDVTMRSVFGLKRGGLDYIVIDGGSTDGTVEVIKTHAHRLKCWRSEPDNGIYDAMNKGWTLADPDSRLLFLGAGDRLLSLPGDEHGDIESLIVLYGNVQLEGGQLFHAGAGCRLRLYNALHHQALLVPKKLHPAAPFDLSYPRYADFDFNQRLARRGVKFLFEPALSAYAAADGLTKELHLGELASIIRKNYGPLWSWLSIVGFNLARGIPLLAKLRPIRKIT